MADLPGQLGFLLRKAALGAKGAARAIRSTLEADPWEVLGYRGFGNGARAWIHGRVVEKRRVTESSDADTMLRNLLNTWRRADSDPLPHATLAVDHAGSVTRMQGDDEGFFGGWIDGGGIGGDDEWHDYVAQVESPRPVDGARVEGAGQILVPPASARLGVISDIDDTVIQSRVSNFLQAARTVMLGNARTRLPFPGVAAFYQALRNGPSGDEKNPVFYVSSSPWNIFDVISEFMELQNIPRGPLMLRDWDIHPGALASGRHFEHKGIAIRSILDTYPQLEFVLVGDTSQHDPEIYSGIVHEYPRRIRAIYIRDVTRSAARMESVQRLADEVREAHSSLVLSEDTVGAARHAAEHGFLSPDALPGIGHENRVDEGIEPGKVEPQPA